MNETKSDVAVINSLGSPIHIISSYLKHKQNTFNDMMLKLHIKFCFKCEQYFYLIYAIGMILTIGLAIIYHNNLSFAGEMLLAWIITTGIAIYEGCNLYTLIPKLINKKI